MISFAKLLSTAAISTSTLAKVSALYANTQSPQCSA